MMDPSNDNDQILRSLFNTDELRKLLATGVRLHRDPKDRYSSLHYAADQGAIDAVKLLLENGGVEFINDFDENAFTPLMHAALNGHADVVALLLEHGADVNAHDEEQIGDTALRRIVDEAPISMVRQLLDAGADPNIPGWMQLTAKMKAQQRYDKQRDPESKEILALVERAAKSSPERRI